MVSITEFLEARIAEDEVVARAASPGPWHTDAESNDVVAVDGITVAEGFALSGSQLRSTTQHIARHDPTRVLAECAAKRAIIELAAKVEDAEDMMAQEWATPEVMAGGILLTLAAIYKDHPDYRQEWA